MPLIAEWNDAIAHVQEVFDRMTDKDPRLVEVRHGRWINGRCSECGEHAPFWALATTYYLSKFCHGCGAKMDGGQDGD